MEIKTTQNVLLPGYAKAKGVPIFFFEPVAKVQIYTVSSHLIPSVF